MQNGLKTIITEQGDFQVAKIFARAVGFFERVGYARAAHHLSIMGYNEEAKKIMTEFTRND